ncbi:MAG: ATP-dependent DNA helicase [Pseudomonadota bacterium]
MLFSLADFFSSTGPLAQGVRSYRLRPQQLEMAERIAAAIAENRVFIAEAGTGTGKTYAYLVPALRSGGKVIVSTGTKNLQDQLFFRDIPTLRAILAAPLKTALLKGRANYVCHYHLERALDEGRFAAREDAAYVQRIARFAKETQSGDKAECGDVPEASSVWPMVTSTRDNCLGQECPHHKACFVLAARREALAADVVVVNHHLFFADVMLRDEGIAELLPACNTVIFDEAHQLPETASLFFGEQVSTAQVLDLTRDVRAEALLTARDCLDLPPFCARLEKAAKDWRLVLPLEAARFTLAQLTAYAGFAQAMQGLLDALAALSALLETQAQRGEGLERCWRRALDLSAQFRRWQSGQGGQEEGAEFVRWGESYTHSLQLNATPLNIGSLMQKQMGGHPRAWIFTSATLTVQGSFAHYCAQMGLHGGSPESAQAPESASWESPFDYAKQALLYAPSNLPDPNSAQFTEAVVKAAFPVVQASGGRAFFLCTSLRAMRNTHALLADALARAGLNLPLLLQGEGSKNELLERFRRLGNAILVASQSFWEGVDVRGDALSLVVIDKLPFAPPDDPVLAARIERMKQQGQNAFMDYQLPRAVISVKQGAGRLIRDESDRGVLMICDPRLLTKSYGKQIWRSLPPMKRTRVLAEVEAFFAPQTPL